MCQTASAVSAASLPDTQGHSVSHCEIVTHDCLHYDDTTLHCDAIATSLKRILE